MEQQDDFNSDALFNDGSLQQIDPNVNLEAFQAVSLPSNPFVVERVLNLQHSGCLHRVAWSRLGHIASICNDGNSVDLQCLRFDLRTRTWLLTPKQSEQIGLGDLASLVWSPLATDLAVVDVKGRISVWRPGRPSWNRIVEARSGTQDDTDDSSQVIGLHWLGQERLNPPKDIVQYASKKDTHWAQHRTRANPLGPLYHRAIVTVDRKARLTLLYERMDNTYGRLTIPLIDNHSSVFLHAAFSPTSEGKLLVATHSLEGIISAHWVSIDFTEARQNADALPKLSAETASMNLAAATSNTINNELYDASSYALTHLGIIPTSEINDAEKPPPTIYAVYANCSRNVSPTDAGYLAAGLIRQWTISSVIQELHPRFNDLPAKSSDPVDKLIASIHRSNDKDEQVITTLAHMDNRLGLFISTHDGRSEFLRIDDFSHDLSPLSYAISDHESSSLAQSGFSFPLNPHPSHISLSPTGCVLACYIPSPPASLSLLTMDFQPGTPRSTLSTTTPTSDVAIASIILSFSRACWTNSSIEDLLSLILHTFPASFATALITNLYLTLFRETEFISEQFRGQAPGTPTSDLEKVVQKPVLTKVFSFHYGVSFLALKDNPSPSASLLLSTQWVSLASQLRFVAQVLYMHVRELQQPNHNHGGQPGGQGNVGISNEVVDIMCANIRWTLDLFRYMIGYILEVGDRETNPEFFASDGSVKAGEGEGENGREKEVIDGSQGLVPLLINCHWSRQMLLAILKALKALAKTPEPRSALAAKVVREIQKASVGKGFTIQTLEAMLMAQWVTQGDENERDPVVLRDRQVKMMSTGVVGEMYAGTVRRLRERLFEGLREKGQVDRLKLWLERVQVENVLLESSSGAEMGKGRGVWDVHKKTRIMRGVREKEGGPLMIKTCVRCGKHSEDVNGPPVGLGRYMTQLVLKCVCDGPFVIERWEDAVA